MPGALLRDNLDSYDLSLREFWRVFDRKRFCRVIPLRILTDVKPRVGGKKTKHIQKPDNHGNDDYGIQDGFNRGGHRDVLIDQPEHDSNDNQEEHYLN
jgi:hypothetical protein